MDLGGINVMALAKMLKKPDDDDDSDEDMPSSSVAKLGPADLCQTEIEKPTSQKSNGHKEKDSKDIWATDEIPEGSEYDTIYDPRPEPEYDILFKQAVTSEDMFLGMGNKTPATSSCEDMVVKIILPDTTMADVTLDVKNKFLDCRTPKYKLGLHLPHPVDHENGKAKWDSKNQTLIVSLKMAREYDFANF